jgi:hypothetical protein
MVIGSSAATSGSWSGSGGAEEGREGGEGEREVMVSFLEVVVMFASGVFGFGLLCCVVLECAGLGLGWRWELIGRRLRN